MAKSAQASRQLDLVVDGLPPDALRRIVEEHCEAAGLQFKFLGGSNPTIHFHIHGELMAKTNVDKSTGPTLSKTFGDNSPATSHGDLIQKTVVKRASAAKLVKALD